MASRALAAKKSEKKRYRFFGALEVVRRDPAMMDRGVWQLQQLPACPYYRVQYGSQDNRAPFGQRI